MRSSSEAREKIIPPSPSLSRCATSRSIDQSRSMEQPVPIKGQSNSLINNGLIIAEKSLFGLGDMFQSFRFLGHGCVAFISTCFFMIIDY